MRRYCSSLKLMPPIARNVHTLTRSHERFTKFRLPAGQTWNLHRQGDQLFYRVISSCRHSLIKCVLSNSILNHHLSAFNNLERSESKFEIRNDVIIPALLKDSMNVRDRSYQLYDHTRKLPSLEKNVRSACWGLA